MEKCDREEVDGAECSSLAYYAGIFSVDAVGRCDRPPESNALRGLCRHRSVATQGATEPVFEVELHSADVQRADISDARVCSSLAEPSPVPCDVVVAEADAGVACFDCRNAEMEAAGFVCVFGEVAAVHPEPK